MKFRAARLRHTDRINHNLLLWLLLLSIIIWTVSPIPSIFASPAQQTSASNERAQALLELLTPEERVGQLFLVTFTGTDVSQESLIYDLIVNHHIGGILLQAEKDNFVDAPQTLPEAVQLTRRLQTNEWSASQARQIEPVTNQEFTPSFIPLFIGISQEGDGYPYDQILSGLTPLPSQMALGATWQPDLAQKVGSILGKELSALGVNLLIGPSLDVLETPHPQSTGDLGVRTFGGDPFWVAKMSQAYISGVHLGSTERIAVVGKHFPGHGSSDRLPEEEVATVRKSLEQLKQIELAPFFAVTGNAPAPEATIDALLVSHIRYQGFQGNIRATTRPVSLDPQAFAQLMSLPTLSTWRESGGIIISDNLGSRAFRRFIDPGGLSFNARFAARDAFLTGNDLLFLGGDFIANEDPDYYTTVLRTLAFFTQKYREDPAFAQRVDISVLRILSLKFRLYNNIFTLSQVLPPQDGFISVGNEGQATFEVAQKAATLVSPSLAELAVTLPEPPGLNDRIVFISDTRTVRQCSLCQEQSILDNKALEQAVMRLYGPQAGGQVQKRNLKSYSYADLQAWLDNADPTLHFEIEVDLQQSNWVVFAMLNRNSADPTSQVLSRFLAEKPDLFRQKKLIAFAFNVPYLLDATEVSKLSAYFVLYSKAPPFVEVAARLLFSELPEITGDLPVSIPELGYDLISATAPDPSQLIQLYLDLPEISIPELTPSPEETVQPLFELQDLIPIHTGVILDHNGHPVPDDTPVEFTLTVGNEIITQVEKTRAGIARASFLIKSSGLVEIRAQSEPAKESVILAFDIPSVNGLETSATSTIPIVKTATPEPTSIIIQTPTGEAVPQIRDYPSLEDWFLAFLVSIVTGIMVYWFTISFSTMRWGIRSGLLTLIGSLLAYTYLAVRLPGTSLIIKTTGSWGVLVITLLGAGLGWSVGFGWQKYKKSPKAR